MLLFELLFWFFLSPSTTHMYSTRWTYEYEGSWNLLLMVLSDSQKIPGGGGLLIRIREGDGIL
jgi:hypothetical protein